MDKHFKYGNTPIPNLCQTYFVLIGNPGSLANPTMINILENGQNSIENC